MGTRRSIGAVVVLLAIFSIRFLPSFLNGKELTQYFVFTRDKLTGSFPGSINLKYYSAGDSLAFAESGLRDWSVEEKYSSSPIDVQKPRGPSQAFVPLGSGKERLTGTRLDGKNVPADFVNHPLRFLSEAPLDSLVMLPGIGPVLAERIVSARSGKRPFSSWEEIQQVKGLGPKKVARLQETSGEQ